MLTAENSSLRGTVALTIVSFCVFFGCSKSQSQLVRHEPGEAAKIAIETYDANSDGRLDSNELAKSPALEASVRRFDVDRDGALTAEEIRQRLEKYQTQSEFIGAVVRLTLGGEPLADATVMLEMEPFLGENLPTFEGKSDESGTVSLMSNGKSTQLLPLGIYRVRVQRSGRNDEIILGREIADDVPGVNRLSIEL